MKWMLPVLILLLFISCKPAIVLKKPAEAKTKISGSAFYKKAKAMQWKERDSLALQFILEGNMPAFLSKLVGIKVSITDAATGKKINAEYYVTPDYLSVGNDDDWARIPMTPMTAQKIAVFFDCFLPTKKMTDDIYKAAAVKLEPVPMYSLRDSTVTFWQHHLIIEGQRKGRKGLIAGIKKDVVLSEKVLQNPKPDRVAIYGWHRLDGQPIQPLYTGHVNWYVDYSHGIRLVYRKIKVNGKWLDYKHVLKDKQLRALLCDEQECNFYAYD